MPRASKASRSGKAAAKAPAKKTAADKSRAKAAKAAPKKAAKKPAPKAAAKATTKPASRTTAAKAKKAAPKPAAKKAPPKVAAKAAKKAPAVTAKKAAPKQLPAKAIGRASAARSAGGGVTAPPRPVEPAPRKAAVRGHDAKFLQEMRELLLEERVEYEKQAEAFRAEAEQLAADMEPGDSQFDEETGGEGDTMSIERERDLALSAQARAAVDEIDRALLKIDAGSYGICERCHQPIPKARLKALPYASLCVACKSGGLSRR